MRIDYFFNIADKKMQAFIQEYKPKPVIYRDEKIFMVNYDVIRYKIYSDSCEKCKECLDFRDYESIETANGIVSDYLLYILEKYAYKLEDGNLIKNDDPTAENCVVIGSIKAITELANPCFMRYNKCHHRRHTSIQARTY